MARVALRGNIILPDEILKGGIIVLDGEKIAVVHPAGSAFSSEEGMLFDYAARYISPGLIDIHLHGALGKDVMDGRTQSLEAIAAHQVRCGVTGFVPTTLAAPVPWILAAIESVKSGQKLRPPSEILGVHLEGPFLNIKKRGAQNPAFINDANASRIDSLFKAARGLKIILTLAPEAGKNASFIASLKKKGAVISIGHTEATYEEAIQSFEQGITHATHLFNAMSGFQPREPGAVGAVLDSDKVTAELIADGIHVHPASLRMAIRQKGADKICLVTDSMNAAGLGDGDFNVGGLDVVVKDGQARLKESGALAGSVLTLNRALRNVLLWTGLSISQAIRMVSLTPARVLGFDHEVGSIQPGKYANLAIFDKDFNVIDTIMRGRSILRGKFGV